MFCIAYFGLLTFGLFDITYFVKHLTFKLAFKAKKKILKRIQNTQKLGKYLKYLLNMKIFKVSS